MNGLAKNIIKKSTNYSMKQRQHLGIGYISENGDIFFGSNLNSIKEQFNKKESEIKKQNYADNALVTQLNETSIKS
jgi:ABC-type lipopolysaccharide export system ATPase subunit